jgi:hypothetical protein
MQLTVQLQQSTLIIGLVYQEDFHKKRYTISFIDTVVLRPSVHVYLK